MSMNRELFLNLGLPVVLSLFILGTASCGIKFGSDARQAAENAEKNKSNASFVSVDDTKTEPDVVLVKDSSAKQTKDSMAMEAKDEPQQTARYVRSGKNRRLKTSLAKSLSESDNQTAKNIPNESVKESVEPIKDKDMDKASELALLYPTVQLFGAKLDQSKWILSSTQMQCFLRQPIPGLGRAKFKFNPVQHLQFVFEVNHPISKKLKTKDTHYRHPLFTDKYPYPAIGAKIESVPPNWKPFAIKKTLGYIPLTEGYTPFTLPHRKDIPASQSVIERKISNGKSRQQVVSISQNTLPEIWPDRLMYELEEGMTIRLTYRDWTDGTQDVITSISPISFKKMKGDFEKCIGKLPKYNFNKFKETKLFFGKGQRALGKKMRNKLRNMVKFIKLDETIKKVMIKSYTDSMGFKRVNRNAAKTQAQAIKAYMRKLGMKVPITAVGIGEGPFVASNRSSAGRAKNRRSIITLIK